MNGILNLNKPRGRTSFDIIAAIKKISNEKRVGHAGTLDPAASGVLPVCIGKATRVIEYLMDSTKTYNADIELGASTDTYDADGKIVKTGDCSTVTVAQVKSMLSEFRGNIIQVPPVYSALKKNGRPLYELARKGAAITPEGRPITIYDISILDWIPPIVKIRVVCGKGTYIRSLANDLGEKLGCGAFLKSLVRESYGPFNINDSITLNEFEESVKSGYREQFLYPIDAVIKHLPMVTLTEDEALMVANGVDIPIMRLLTTFSSQPLTSCYCRSYLPSGQLLAVLKYNSESRLWHPEKVFTLDTPSVK